MTSRRFGFLAVARLASMIAAPAAVRGAEAATVYVAHLQPMNSSIAGHDASGEARFTIAKDKLTRRSPRPSVIRISISTGAS